MVTGQSTIALLAKVANFCLAHPFVICSGSESYISVKSTIYSRIIIASHGNFCHTDRDNDLRCVEYILARRTCISDLTARDIGH